jgi:tight adherence protein B
MKRASLLFAAVLFTALVAAVSAGARAGGVSITPASGKFPNKNFILSLPAKASLKPGQVSVTENGAPVTGVSVVPESASAGSSARFGVALVVDASDSMQGAPIQAAMSAARAFVAQRAPGQQIAFVTFNSKTNVLLPLTKTSATIAAAIDHAPSLAYGTHMYDSVSSVIKLLSAANLDSASIVLLSDGADTGSANSLQKTLAAARAAHVRIYTVGLHSKKFDPSSLQALAAGANGVYAEAKPSELTGLYHSLGAQLAGQYLVRYQSFAGPKQPVTVRIRVKGIPGVAKSHYDAPPLEQIAIPKTFHRTQFARIVLSPYTAIGVVLACALLAGIALASALTPTHNHLRKRMAEFVSMATPRDDRPAVGGTEGRSGVLGGTERSLESQAWWQNFKEELAIAEIKMPAIEIIALTFIGTIVLILALSVAIGSALFGVLGLAFPFAVRAFLKAKLARRRGEFADQLPDCLQIIASALRGGHSLVGSLSVVVDAAGEPMKSEMARVVQDEALGTPLEDALAVVARRMDNTDLDQLGLVARLQRDTGVSAAEVIDRVTETVRERFELRRLVSTLTSQARMSRWIVTALPVGLLVVISLLNPHYLHPLFTRLSGRALLVAAALLVMGGSLVIKKIVNIKV